LNYDWDYGYDWTIAEGEDKKPKPVKEYSNKFIKVRINYQPEEAK